MVPDYGIGQSYWPATLIDNLGPVFIIHTNYRKKIEVIPDLIMFPLLPNHFLSSPTIIF